MTSGVEACFSGVGGSTVAFFRESSNFGLGRGRSHGKKGAGYPPDRGHSALHGRLLQKTIKSWSKAHIVDALDTTDRFPALFAASHTSCLQVAQEFHVRLGREEPWR
jgi:hypothetical protein